MNKIITDLKDDIISMELTNKAKSILANMLLIGVGLSWIIGVDSIPVMKVLGLPLFIGAMMVWFKYSNTWKSVSNFMDRGINGEFDE
jgi:hypothetical protein